MASQPYNEVTLSEMLLPALALLLFAPERPLDVWVFRSVLDRRPRMTTVALHKDLWVAYDATNCGLYKAWKGDVKFDGSVYTAEHGPQPTSQGTDVWLGAVDRPAYRFLWKGKQIKPRFRGYRFESGHVTFNTEFELGGKQSAFVHETPEYADGAFTRSFVVEGIPTDARLTLDLGRWISAEGAVTTLGKSVDLTRPIDLPNGKTTINAKVPGADQGNAERVAAMPDAFPSSKPTEIEGLAPKIWPDSDSRSGSSPKMRGPSTSEDRLSLEGVGHRGYKLRVPNAQQEPLTDGLALRVYWIGEPLITVPILISGQTPNYSTITTRLDLTTKEDWGGIEDQFYAELSGYLKISQAGEYTFKLTSDDGSIMYLEEQKLIDNDGLHGDQSIERTTKLNPGLYPLKIEFFDEGAGNVLRLEWKKPGAKDFEVIPGSSFQTPRGEVKVTAPGKKVIADPAKRNRPGDARPEEGVHPSYALATVRPETFKPKVGGIDFLPSGKMVICNWEPEGGVYTLDGVQARNPHGIKVQRIAFGLAEPLGLKVVDGEIYILQKQELTKLVDHNKDGVIDEYYCVANGWGVTPNFHEFAFGLVYKDGYFYGNLAIAINPGGKSTQPQNQDRGKTIKIGRDGSFEFVASGLRTPNGIGIGFKGEIFIADNQGDWLPASKILHLKKGAFYNSLAVNPIGDANKKVTPPVVWLPQGEIGNSPCTPLLVPSGPFKGQMMHGDVTHGGVKRVFVEEVNGQLQGCVFRYTQGLEAGINRILFGPDGALYVGGIGSSGNWGQDGKEKFGLQRLTYNGKPTFEIFAVRAYKNGMELEFTEPMMQGIGHDPADYKMRTWHYVPTIEYGGPKIDEAEAIIESVSISPDRKRVFLETASLKPGKVVYVRLGRGLMSQAGRLAWATEGWYTLNQIPNRTYKVTAIPRPVNKLTTEESQNGFVLLGAKDFRGYKKTDLPAGWKPDGGGISFIPGIAGGDIITKEQYGDFDLRLEWKVESGGNSGIIVHTRETKEYSFETGSEYQVLDDDRAGDGRNTLTSASSLYGLIPRKVDMVRPAGTWNEARIVCRGSKLEHWLNGMKVMEADFDSAELKALIANSKYNVMPEYGKYRSGHIAFQDHGNKVSFRTIRIRKL